METIHFPDQPCPSWITHPVLAFGNFDGLHRGHLKIIERVKRGAAERGGTPMAMTFDPHPPRIVRPDKAPPLLMTTSQRLDALHQAGLQARGGGALHDGAVAVGRRDLRAPRAGGLAARVGGVGRRQLPLRARAAGQLQPAALAGPYLRIPRRQDRPGAVSRLHRQQHACPAAGGRGSGGRGRSAAGPGLRHRGNGRGGAPPRAGTGVSHREPRDRRTS